jgi:hypothetical protein
MGVQSHLLLELAAAALEARSQCALAIARLQPDLVAACRSRQVTDAKVAVCSYPVVLAGKVVVGQLRFAVAAVLLASADQYGLALLLVALQVVTYLWRAENRASEVANSRSARGPQPHAQVVT